MKQAYALLAFTFVFVSSSLFAQQLPPCGFDGMHKRQLKENPVYAKTVKGNDEAIRRYINNHPPSKTREGNRMMATYTIPVVVHVMHTGGAIGSNDNPTDAQIQGAIDYLNQVYAGTYPGMEPPVGGTSVLDMQLQFALAQRTPACGATNGIERINVSGNATYVARGVNADSTNGVNEIVIKNLSRWTTSDYYNIWLVNKIDSKDGTSGSFTAGFAYFPGSGSLDGTIMLATQMIAGQKTLPHEIGHAFTLYHPFEGADPVTCAPNGSCSTDGDECCDTDPVTYPVSFACRTGSNSCPGGLTYNRNTESNYMAYTFCYTLFTNDQKARVQAAMSLSDRASFVAPSNLALVPCSPTINFNLATSTHGEDPAGTLTGCRRYTDYTYQMTIGVGPTAAATATLTYSGSATKGVDYDVTTNGNFASPSNVINFPAGSTASHSFTVRIYDDADVEGISEAAIIDFTLNNGGGNATKGSFAPTLNITIPDNDVAPTGSTSNNFTVGTSVGNIPDLPFDARQQSQRAQYLYKASELTAAGLTAGNITALQLFVQTKNSTRPFTNFTIKMAHTNTTYLINGSANPVSGMTTVFNPASYSTATGWNNFTLNTPFNWNGTQNLAIEICYDNSTFNGAAGQDQVNFYSDGGTASQANSFYQNGINCSGTFSSFNYYGNGLKPVIILSTAGPGTPIETVVSSNATLNIESGSSDYFYSNNSKLMMQLTGVNASLGCVSSSLDAAGTTWVSYSGGQRSAKIFAVTPTTNGSTASYTAALYFDNTELGGKPAGSLRIAKTTAASVAASNSSNTIVVTPTVTTLGPNTTVFTGNFTGFSRFFLIDASVTLPVELTTFTGRSNDDRNTVLNWVTASEQNNKQFDIEYSMNGSDFSLLGSVASQGNSGFEQKYEYIHIKPQSGTTWYRLKQVDIDGRATYSNIITVVISDETFKPIVYPVPARDVVTINFGMALKKAEIEILSADMKSVKRETITGSTIKKEINIHSLSHGLYFIRITTDNDSRLLRFIKQ